MKIVVTSDLHYGLKSAGYDRTEEINNVANSIVTYAIDRKADFFVHCGDLGHVANPSSTIHGLWVRLFYRLANAGIKSYFLLGNHDVTGTSSDRSGSLAPLRQLKLETVQAITSPSIMSIIPDGISYRQSDSPKPHFLFLPYTKPDSNGVDENEELVAKFRKDLDDPSNVVVAFTHLNVDGALINDEHILRPIKTVIPKRLFNRRGVRVVVSGHIHRPQRVETGTGVQHYIVGSPICTDFGDMAKKSFLEIDIDGYDVEVNRVRSGMAIPLIELEYNVHKEQTPRLAVTDQVREMVKGAGVKVKVTCLEGQVGELGLREFEGELASVAEFVRPIVPVVLRQRDDKFKVISGDMTDEEAVLAWVASRKPANKELVRFHALKAVEDVG